MKFYAVISPEYGKVEPVCDDGTGPMEYGCDVVYVEAANKREARAKAIKMPGLRDHVDIQRGDGCSPFTGLRVEEVFESEFREQERIEKALAQSHANWLLRRAIAQGIVAAERSEGPTKEDGTREKPGGESSSHAPQTDRPTSL